MYLYLNRKLYSDKYQDNDNKNDLIDNEVLIN